MKFNIIIRQTASLINTSPVFQLIQNFICHETTTENINLHPSYLSTNPDCSNNKYANMVIANFQQLFVSNCNAVYISNCIILKARRLLSRNL